jgi:hypothetical protein
VKPELPGPPPSDAGKKHVNEPGKPTGKGTKLYRFGLTFCLLGSLLIVVEGIKIILFSPLSYQITILADWGGYFDLMFGILSLLGLLGVAYAHNHKKLKTISAAVIGLLCILSLVLFGGGFYLGFILGMFGALLTAARE